MEQVFESEYCSVFYYEKENVVGLSWKKFAAFGNYRRPAMAALEALRVHKGSNFLIDARHGFEDEKEDVEWGFSYLLPNMQKAGCKKVAFLMEQASTIEGEMDMWSLEFRKYFQLYKTTEFVNAMAYLEGKVLEL